MMTAQRLSFIVAFQLLLLLAFIQARADNALFFLPPGAKLVKVDATSGILSTNAETAGGRYSGIAINAQGDVFYGIEQFSPYRVRLYRRSWTGTMEPFGSVISTMSSEVVDSSFDFSLATFDSSHIAYNVPWHGTTPATINEMDVETKTTQTLVASSVGNFFGMTYDTNRNLFYGREYGPTRSSTNHMGLFYLPEGGGEVFISDISPKGGLVEAWKTDLAISPDNQYLYFTAAASSQIRRLDLQTFLTSGSVVVTNLDSTSGLNFFGGLSVGSGGTLYFMESHSYSTPAQYILKKLDPMASSPDVVSVVDINKGGYQNWNRPDLAVIRPRVHALLIGVDWPDRLDQSGVLRTNVRGSIDVTNLAATLGHFPLTSCLSLVMQSTNQSGINPSLLLNAYVTLSNTLSANDLVVFYVSTHGGFINTNSGLEEWKNMRTNSDTSGTVSNNNNEYLSFGDTNYILWDDRLAGRLKGGIWDSVDKLVVLDTCYSGGFWGSTNRGDPGDLAQLSRVALLGAVEETELAACLDDGSGMFTAALCIAISNLSLSGTSPTFLALKWATEDVYYAIDNWTNRLVATNNGYYAIIREGSDDFFSNQWSVLAPVEIKNLEADLSQDFDSTLFAALAGPCGPTPKPQWLQSLNSGGGHLSFPFSGIPGRQTYSVYISSDLRSWQQFTNLTSTSAIIDFNIQPQGSVGFFRIGTAPTNDAFTNAAVLTGLPVSNYVSSVGSSKEPGEPNHVGVNGGRSLWWRWTAPATNKVQITVTGALPFPAVAVYTGTALNALTYKAGGDGDPERPVTLLPQTGVEYSIAVDSATGCSGDYTLRLELSP